MPEPFKNLISPELILRSGEVLAEHVGHFQLDRFIQLASKNLVNLELKERVLQLASALDEVMPSDFHESADALKKAYSPIKNGRVDESKGLSGLVLWPVGEFIARRGIDNPALSLDLLHGLTQRYTAEFAVRPFIVKHQEYVLERFKEWTKDPSEHVRRLVSEGSRPRLPWGLQLRSFIADPSPVFPLLESLQDDSSAYVRRSVANHLNDIAKDHPDIVADWLDKWLASSSKERRALFKHSSRTLIKKGNSRVMAAWGIGERFDGSVTVEASPREIHLNENVKIKVCLKSTGSRTQKIALDYIVHHVKADGKLSPKVFKGWETEIRPGESRCLEKRHSMKIVTTRKYYPGIHKIEIQINGFTECSCDFDLSISE